MSDIKLFNQSCLDFLPSVASKSVDLIILDPPYVISRPTSFMECGPQGVERLRISYDFGEWDYEIFVLDEVMKECYRVLKNHGTLICFYDLWKIETLKNWIEGANFKQIRFIEWLKTNPVPINSKVNYLTNSREIAVLGVKGGKPTFNSEYDNGLYQFPICHEKDRFHPNQKPLNLLESLIKKHSNDGDLIMDCFAGSSSCAVACHNTNRNFVGCELDETFYNKSLERIAKLTS
jgi:site-specific DNA-methyltransferase (adenine-specific)